MMKKILAYSCAFLLAMTSCETEEGNPQASDFYASKGDAAGAIYIHFEKDPNVSSVLVDRRAKGDAEWLTITGAGEPFFDDHRFGQEGMPAGKVFEYRIKNDWPDDAPYSEIVEGYAYDIAPITEITITTSETSNALTWNAGNHNSHMNNTDIAFDVYRSDASDGTFELLGEVGEDRSYLDDFTYDTDKQGKTWYYRVDVRYFPYSGTAQGTVVESTGGGTGGTPTVDYQVVDLGATWTASADGGVDHIRMKNYGGVLYAGALNNVGATGYADPSLLKLVSDAWQAAWTAPLSNRFDETSFAVASDRSYVAGIDDSLCVYAWYQDQWSANLCPDNLGKDDSPSAIDIETLNDELYMAIKQSPDYYLQVLKRNGDAWETVGGDASGTISASSSQMHLDLLDGVLYLSYLENDVVHVKHLEGSSWVDDLSWTQSDVGFVQIAKSGSQLYLMAGSNLATYRGGVYQITSTTSVEELASNDSDAWFQFPLALANDSDGNLVLSSMNIESAEVIHPFLSIYDGAEWKSISGDYSGGMDPVALQTLGTTIYYLYGDATNLNALENPRVAKTMKLSPQ